MVKKSFSEIKRPDASQNVERDHILYLFNLCVYFDLSVNLGVFSVVKAEYGIHDAKPKRVAF